MRFILSVLVTLVAAGVTRTQITISTADLDIPNYNNRVQKIVDEQVVNFRTVVERKFWMIDRPDDVKPFRTDRYVAIHGKDLWLSRISIIQSQFPVENGKDYSVVVLSPDESYGLSSGSSGGRHSVQRYYSACEHRKQYSDAIDSFPACLQFYKPLEILAVHEVKEVMEVADDEYEGKPTLRVTLRMTNGAKSVTYLERTTYQHIYTESDKIYDWNARGHVDGKTAARTEYRTHDGRLWPTRHEWYYFKSDGKKRMLSESVFLEYAPHTPTEDDLDAEKQFGVKLVPPEPRPDPATLKPPEAQPKPATLPPPGDHTRMYSIACLVFVAVVVAVLYRYT